MRTFIYLLFVIALFSSCKKENKEQEEPLFSGPYNIVYIMSDDHAKKAISAYDTTLIKTPNLDRLAEGGIVFNSAFVTNALCGPSRAVMLTGKYSHINGFRDNGDTFNADQWTLPKELQKNGYQTAVVGKWHLKSKPQGFNHYTVLIDQGEYYNPRFVTEADTLRPIGYTTDLITDKAIEWLDTRDSLKPFMLMVHHKAPHRNWMPNTKHLSLFNEDVPVPDNFFDDYENRSDAAAQQDMRIDDMFLSMDLKLQPDNYEKETGTGGGGPNFDPERNWKNIYGRLTEEQRKEWDAHYDSIGDNFRKSDLTGKELSLWKYQRYMKDYLRSIYSVDENVGRLLDYLEKNDLMESTIIIYTSDQGFYLGEHGWYDKRFMYEESFGTPLLMHIPNYSGPSRREEMVMNLDFAPTLLDYAGVPSLPELQGKSLRNIIEGKDSEWRNSVYYHYYEYPHGWHNVKKHYGVRNERYKLVHYYNDIDQWELFDLKNDPNEMVNLYDHPEYIDMVDNMKNELLKLQKEYHEPDSIVQKTIQKTE
ncbi:MAG: sulfatase [Cyclobacteriaceae bacterium]|nr:sulfatase [Cyclobacteriaceae bacterium]